MGSNRGNRHEHSDGQHQGPLKTAGSTGVRRANASMTERSARQLTETAVEVVGRVVWQSMGSTGASGANVDGESI